MNALFEFLPLILFLGAFLYKDIYAALIVLMIAMPIGLVVKYVRTGKWDKMYLWSTVFLLVAGALTLYFRNPLFLYWKPTAFYWAVAVAFFASFWVGEQTLVQRFFGMITDVSLGVSDPHLTFNPPDVSNPFIAEVLGNAGTTLSPSDSKPPFCRPEGDLVTGGDGWNARTPSIGFLTDPRSPPLAL